MKRILVIDGNSIINRAFYGVRPLTTKSGKHTNAIFGMISIISRQLNELKPDYAAVAFDVKHPTFRHEMYAEYKAGRHATPEELLSQFADAKECLSLMGLHVLELPGYEADDIQGTVAKMAHSEADTVSYVLSGDRDLLQLIDDRVTVLLATNNDTKLMGREEFAAEYGVAPEAFVDMKALMGDSSDNIPGVGGVGKKTAEALIRDFGSLDGIYECIDDKRITKGVREKLLRDRDNAYLSQALARINTNSPINKSLSELEYKGLDKAGLYRKFVELELNSFIAKFGLSGVDVAEKQPVAAKKTDPSQEEIAGPCDSAEVTPTDTESAIFEPADAEKLKNVTRDRVSVEFMQTKLYISAGGKNLVYDGELSALSGIFDGCELICYDAKALLHTLASGGALPKNAKYLDLSLYGYVINPGAGGGGIESLCAEFIGKMPASGTPCCVFYDELEKKLRERIESDGLSGVLFDIELPLVEVLFEIERAGFRIDPDGIREFGDALGELAEDLATRIYMQAGREFNINSPKQLGEVLYVDLGLSAGKKKKTKTGYSTDAETLEELRAQSPIVDNILEYRQVTKLRSTYALVLPEVADESHRIHTDFKQALTATGRLSSADPNLQNIPIRTKMGREFRRYFIADEGYTLVDADYSQIELRLLAHISDDYNMREAFLSGEDIHRKTAAAVFGMPEEMVNDEMRKRAKAVNFGIVYGISGYSLSRDVGTTVAEATKYIKNYLMNYPSIDRYLEEVVEKAKECGYTSTVFGRRRYIPELASQNAVMRSFGKRVAMNAPIQGTAADIMKLAMIGVAGRLKSEGLDARIVMQVHDELVIEARDEIVQRVKNVVREEMEGVASLSVPLTVDVSSGKSWLEQK